MPAVPVSPLGRISGAVRLRHQHTVALAHALGLRLVAEGVEEYRTVAALAAHGCDVAQGYAIARPMPSADFRAWLAAPRAFLLDR